MKTKILSLILFLFTCTCLLALMADKAYCQKKPPAKKISIELDYVPKGDMSIILNDVTLSKLLAELQEPQVFSDKDVFDDFEKDFYVAADYKFVLQGDFKRDGNKSMAFIVRDKKFVQKKQVYLVIVTFKNNSVTRDIFRKLKDRAYLRFEPSFKKGIDAIFLAHSLNSDVCEYIYWNGKQYFTKTCAELNKYY